MKILTFKIINASSASYFTALGYGQFKNTVQVTVLKHTCEWRVFF